MPGPGHRQQQLLRLGPNPEKAPAQERDEQRLAELITEVHTAQPAYGVQRITRELQRQGVPVGRRVVARLMRALAIVGVTGRKRRNPTKPDASANVMPDLIRRDFTAHARTQAHRRHQLFSDCRGLAVPGDCP
jgi:transposase InsO family protein